RMSLILSIVRLIPPFFSLRRTTECSFAGFLLMWISTLGAKIYACASNLTWYQGSSATCKLGGHVGIAIYEVVSSLVADITLIAIPLRLLHRISLGSKKRRMLILMFSVNIVTSTIAVVRTIFVLHQAWSPATIVVEVEVGTALIAANLAVLTPYIYRLFKSDGDFDS
ncbi:hypothetical protein GYMLUDRAFT_142668, partial [Collybiopsis luxurians FD-317 M1]